MTLLEELKIIEEEWEDSLNASNKYHDNKIENNKLKDNLCKQGKKEYCDSGKKFNIIDKIKNDEEVKTDKRYDVSGNGRLIKPSLLGSLYGGYATEKSRKLDNVNKSLKR
jgi:hypothetical protein